MDAILNTPISSHIVHIRSVDATQIHPTLNTHFNVLLEAPIVVEKGHEAHIIMSSLEMPYSFYNVSSDLNNNVIIYDTSSTFTFPNKNYSVDLVVSTITDDSGFPFSASFDRATMKMTLTNTSGISHTINWSNANSTAYKFLGFDNTGDDVVGASATTISDNVVNMASVHSLLIRSNLATANVQSTTSSNSTILQKVSVDVNGWSMIYLNQDDYRTTNIITTNQIDDIEMKITDQYNNLINLNACEFELSLLIMIYETPAHEAWHQAIHHAQPRKYNIPIPRKRVDFISRQPLQQLYEMGRPRIYNVAPQRALTTPQQQYGFFSSAPSKTIDDTHAVQNKSDLEHVAEQTILESLLNNIQ